MAQATVLRPGQYRHLIRATRATSRSPERDVLVLLMGIHMGMRVSEIAQVEVGDFMFVSGKLRQEVSLRAALKIFNKMDMRFDQHRRLDWLINCVHFNIKLNG